jgi:prenyltransferase beta subunit
MLRNDDKVGGEIDFKGAIYMAVFLSSLLASLSVIGVTLHNNLNESLVYLSECFV